MGKGRRTETGTPALALLSRVGVNHSVHTYEHDPRAQAYGMEAAEALGLDPALVYKTLIVNSPDGLGVGVLPVADRLDLKAMAAALGVKKVAMAEPAVAERSSGYVVGGISPLGQRTPLPTVIDLSAQSLGTMYVSGGRRGMDIGLAPADLAALTGGCFATITQCVITQ